MSTARRLAVVVLAAGGLLAFAAAASAHPLGNFTINVYAGLLVRNEAVTVDYVVDMAEIPTFQAIPSIDTDGDGSASLAELDVWAAAQAPGLADRLWLMVDGERVELEPATADARFRPGQGGLDTLRLEIVLRARVPPRGLLEFRNGTFPDRIGWREITATSGQGSVFVRSSVPSTSVSDRLRSYPVGRLQSPLRVTTATLSYRPGTGPRPTDPSQTGGGRRSDGRPGVVEGGFADLARSRGGVFVASALVLAAGFGALHALGPGHGKTLMAAYFVGSKGRLGHAAWVGVTVAAMHSASVVALGLLVISAQRVFPIERVYGWLGLFTGLAATVLGMALLRSRLREHRRAHEHDVRGIGDDPHGAHGDEPHHHHGHGLPSRRDAARGRGGRPGLAALALAGGALPSPSALVVLLASISIGRPAFGLALISAFSAGLAATLIGVGVLTLRVRTVVERRAPRSALRLLPLGSAAAILGIGAVLAARGLAQL